MKHRVYYCFDWHFQLDQFTRYLLVMYSSGLAESWIQAAFRFQILSSPNRLSVRTVWAWI